MSFPAGHRAISLPLLSPQVPRRPLHGGRAISFTSTHADSACGRAAGVAGEPLRTASGRCLAGDLWSQGSPGVVAPCGQVKDDFSAPRLRQSPHPAPAGGARRHRGPPSAPRLVRATRDRTPAPPGSAERHAALAPAPATDRRRAGDGAEARGMDALALAIGPSRVADSSTRGGQARVLNRPHGPPRRAP